LSRFSPLGKRNTTVGHYTNGNTLRILQMVTGVNHYLNFDGEGLRRTSTFSGLRQKPPNPMKFEDLIFFPHPDQGIEAFIFFPNRFGAQVSGGPGHLGDGETTFEVTVLQGTQDDHDIYLFNDLCDHSIPYATKEVVEEVINDIATFVPNLDEKENP
jgi:hypothetical protein